MQVLSDKQHNAIAKLRELKVGALWMKMGTGKTLSAKKLIESVVGCDYVLWLTPFQTKDNLLSEINKWGGLPNLEIVGIETLSSSDRTFLYLQNKVKSSNAFILVDESLKIKNEDARRTQRIIELGKDSQWRLILNGTPLSRNLLDVWSQLEFLSPKILNMGMAEFKNTFCEYTKITKRFGNRMYSKEFITKYHNVDYLYSIISPYVYECDLDLEVGRQYHDIGYKLCEESRGKYQYIKDEYLDNEKLQFLNNNIFLELTMKMQHLYCCTEEKFDIVSDLLKANKSEKVLCYTKYIDSRVALESKFKDLKVLSYQKHAFGLNLQSYNVSIFFDKTFDYATRLQAEARTYRVGQKEDCLYYDLTGDVGLETIINDNITKKQGLSEYFNQVGKEAIKKL